MAIDIIARGLAVQLRLLTAARFIGTTVLALGRDAGFDLTSGGNNTFLGFNTGRGITTGANNTIVGANVTGLAAGLSNNIILADGAGNQRLNIDAAGNIGIGANIIVDTNRIFRLRSYTVATVPAASVAAGALIYVSNPTSGNPRAFTSDGTNWYDGAGLPGPSGPDQVSLIIALAVSL